MAKHKIEVDIPTIKRMYEEEGADITEIAKELCCKSCIIASRIKESGFKKKDKNDFITEDFLKELYIDEGMSIREVANKLGVKVDVVRRRLKKFNIPRKPLGGKYDIKEDEVRYLFYEKEMSCQEIADYLGCSVSVVRRRFNEFGILLEGSNKRSGKETGVLKDVGKEELERLYISEGKSAKEIAKIYDTTERVVRARLQKFNIGKEFKLNFSRDDLFRWYIIEDLTIRQISKKVKVWDKIISNKLKEYGIVKENKWSSITKEELEYLYLEENLFIEEISEKTRYPRHAIDYYLKLYDLKDKKTEEQEEECKARREERAMGALKERSSYEIELESRYPTYFTNTHRIINAELDLYYPNNGIAIEVNGVRWHGTPADSQKEDKRHIDKMQRCDKKNIQLINIFDYVLKGKKSKEKMLNILDNLLKRDNLRISEGNIDFLESKEQELFENDNNLDNYESTDFCIGIRNNSDEVTSSISGNIKEDMVEIVRFTTKIGYTEDFKRLVDFLCNIYRPNKVEVTCNRNFYNGSLFLSLGFKIVGEVEPDFYYVYNQRIISRTTYQKNPEKYKKYYKVYDCGRIKLQLIL